MIPGILLTIALFGAFMACRATMWFTITWYAAGKPQFKSLSEPLQRQFARAGVVIPVYATLTIGAAFTAGVYS